MEFNIYDYPSINLNTFTLTTIYKDIVTAHIKSNTAVDSDSDNESTTVDLGVCKLCGRKLKDRSSCRLGMGPICFKRYKDRLNSSKSLF